MAPGSDRRALRVALVGGVAARLLLVVAGAVAGHGTQRFLFADSGSYRNVAAHLPTALWRAGPDVVSDSLARTPAYPLFVLLTGGRWWPVATVVAQCLLGGLANVWLAHRLARRLLDERRAGWVALAVAFDPASVGHSLLIATETLATTAVLGTLLLAALLVDRLRARPPTSGWLGGAAAVGAAAGLGALVRPTLAAAPLLAAVGVAVAVRTRRAVAAGLVVLIVAGVPVGGWVVRNDRVGGAAALTTVTGQDLVDFGLAASAVDGGRLDLPLPDQQGTSRILADEADRLGVPGPVAGDVTSAASDRRWTRWGRRLLADHPRGAALVAAASLGRTLSAPGHTAFEAHLPHWAWVVVRLPLAGLGLAWAAAVGLGSLVGAGQALRRRDGPLLALAALPAGLYLLGSVGPWMYLRFRVPVLPLLAILAASVTGGARRGSGSRRGPAPT